MRPQRDIPTEVIIKYVVKDYRRMFLAFDEMQTRAEKAEAQVRELREKNFMKAANIDGLRKEYKQKLDEVRASRNAEIAAVTDDLREQLDEANRKVRILLQAFDNPEVLKSLGGMTLSSTDEKKWMHGCTKQLKKAMMNFDYMETRLDEMRQLMEDGSTEKFDARLSRVLAKMDACTDRIGNFLDKVGDIKIEDNG